MTIFYILSGVVVICFALKYLIDRQDLLVWDEISKFERNNFRPHLNYDLGVDQYKIQTTLPKSDSLIEIRKQLLISINKFVKQYYKENNKPYLDSKYVKIYLKLNNQIEEYFNLIRNEPINTFWELDSLCNNISAYKEACLLLDKNKIK